MSTSRFSVQSGNDADGQVYFTVHDSKINCEIGNSHGPRKIYLKEDAQRYANLLNYADNHRK